MLAPFDWIRLARTGSELLATLDYLEKHPAITEEAGGLAAPLTALHPPCERCWTYPRTTTMARYCPTCQAIRKQARQIYRTSRYATFVWGYVTQLPRQLRDGQRFDRSLALSAYVQDEHHFLAALRRRKLKPWLQELVLYNGADLKGLLQIFPSTGRKSPGMDQLLIRIIHHDARFPPDQLRVRFLAAPHYVFHLHEYDRKGVLTFDVADFISVLEMASVFRTILLPDEQKMLHTLLKTNDGAKAQFYWGRLLNMLNDEAKDMLNAWRVRTWSEAQVDLLYRLSDYVSYY
ncbi:MAG TPA: hypothetical protein ENN19_17090 [Chloroflexi bacterium]|nr:hypothetical protein [Chloroflexota bacterium]